MEMNKLNKILCAVALASVGSTANADLFYVDGNQDSVVSSAPVLSSAFTTQPVSYYIDDNGNGFVDNGETVFDFGLGIDVTYLRDGNGNPISSPFGTQANDQYLNGGWGLTFDYFLIGTAQVDGDGVFDSASDSLTASFNQGMLNMFVDQDVNAGDFDVNGVSDFDRDLLALTYDVTSSVGQEGLVSIFGELVYAADGYFFDENMVDYADLTGSIFGDVAVKIEAPSSTSPIPGTVTNGTFTPTGGNFDTETSGDFGLGANGLVPTSYHGDSIIDITQAANDCTATGVGSEQNSAFGWCSGNNTDVPEDPTQVLWAEIRNFVRDLDESGSPILARTTLVTGDLYNKIPEPTSVAIFGLALLGMAGMSRRAKK